MGDIHFKRIQEQSELEMKQKLSDNQISLLLKNDSIESYCAKIEKVMMGSNNLFSLKCTLCIFSMDMDGSNLICWFQEILNILVLLLKIEPRQMEIVLYMVRIFI